jgi:hypothetical protein
VKLTTAAAIIVISLVITGRASGGFITGNMLYANCTSSTSVERAICIGYVEGVLDAGEDEGTYAWFLQGAKAPQKDPKATLGGVRWCSRETVTAGQAVDVVTAFLRNNPAYRDSNAPGLVARALQQAWPCSQ